MMNVFSKSKWIWFSHDAQKADEYAEFFTTFKYEQGECIINISADSDYVLYVNGKIVESNQYGDFEWYKIYDEISLTDYLVKGENNLAILVYHCGKSTSRYCPFKAGLIFEVICVKNILCYSSDNVLSRLSNTYVSYREQVLSEQYGFNFKYDSTKEDDWKNKKQIGFLPSVIVDKQCEFFLRPINKLRRTNKVSGKVIKNDGNLDFIIDLGRENVGLPFLNFDSDIEQNVVVAFGERLDDGQVLKEIGGRNFIFEYVAKKRNNDFTEYLMRLGCRYLQITTQFPISLKQAGIVEQRYEVSRLDFTFIKDERDKQIYEICIRTLELCMLEHYVDCPWREQCLYVFDSRNQMLCGYYAFNNKNLEYARATLKLFSMDNRDDGVLSICTPSGGSLAIPSFSLYYLFAVEEYFTASGDEELLREVFPKIQSIINAFILQKKDNLICKFSGKEYWNFYDWSVFSEGCLGEQEKSIPDCVINCLMILALGRYQKIAGIIKKNINVQSLIDQLRLGVKSEFFDKECGYFTMHQGKAEYTELCNSLAILAGVASNEESLHILQGMCDKKFIPCSLSLKCFKYDAYLHVDKTKYKQQILEEIRDDYGKMISFGATSVWETIDGCKAFDGAGSLCHGWSAMPIYYYHKLLK